MGIASDHFQDLLLRYMKRKDWSRKELAEACKMNRATLTGQLGGRAKIPHDVLTKLVDVLELEQDEARHFIVYAYLGQMPDEIQEQIVETLNQSAPGTQILEIFKALSVPLRKMAKEVVAGNLEREVILEGLMQCIVVLDELEEQLATTDLDHVVNGQRTNSLR